MSLACQLGIIMLMPKELDYDLIIIGAGPAGMTAGVYAARKQLRTLILSRDIGGQAAWSSDVENYPGFSMVSGADLVNKFHEHLEQFKDSVKLQLVTKGVHSIQKVGTHFLVNYGESDKVTTASIIIAGGKVPRELGIKGEKEYLNRGVTYCAWCDGPLFRGKDIAIIGGGNSALDAALNVEKLVRQIYIINVEAELTADPVMIDKVKEALNIRIMNDTKVTSINGDKLVNAISVQHGHSASAKQLPVEGVFVEIGSIPATDYLRGIVKLNRAGEIVIDEHNMTSLDGVFAAGDITTVLEKQIVTAAGEGAKAAIQASQYLAKRKHY